MAIRFKSQTSCKPLNHFTTRPILVAFNLYTLNHNEVCKLKLKHIANSSNVEGQDLMAVNRVLNISIKRLKHKVKKSLVVQ